MPENLPALRGRSIGGTGLRIPRREEDEVFDLMDLDVIERSFVENPAVPGALSFLVKSLVDKTEAQESFDDNEEDKPMDDSFEKALTQKDKNAIAGAIRIMSGIKNPPAEVVEALRALRAAAGEEKKKNLSDELEVNVMDEQVAQAETVEEETPEVEEVEVTETTDEATTVEVTLEAAEPAEDMVAKSDVQTMIEKAVKAAVQPMRDELAKAQAEAYAEREKRREHEFVQKARGFVALSEPVENLARILKTAYDINEVYGKELEQLLKAADRGLHAAGIFKEIGTAGESADTDNSFLAKVEKRAAELRAADPAMKYEEAYRDAYMQVGRENQGEAQAFVRERQRTTLKS